MASISLSIWHYHRAFACTGLQFYHRTLDNSSSLALWNPWPGASSWYWGCAELSASRSSGKPFHKPLRNPQRASRRLFGRRPLQILPIFWWRLGTQRLPVWMFEGLSWGWALKHGHSNCASGGTRGILLCFSLLCLPEFLLPYPHLVLGYIIESYWRYPKERLRQWIYKFPSIYSRKPWPSHCITWSMPFADSWRRAYIVFSGGLREPIAGLSLLRTRERVGSSLRKNVCRFGWSDGHRLCWISLINWEIL